MPFTRVVGPNTVRVKEQFVGTADDGGRKEVDGRNCRNGMGADAAGGGPIVITGSLAIESP